MNPKIILSIWLALLILAVLNLVYSAVFGWTTGGQLFNILIMGVILISELNRVIRARRA
jgi:hypothetical protein